MEKGQLKSLLEALLFTATEPLTIDHFCSVSSDTDHSTVIEALDELKRDYESRNAGMVLREVAGGYQMYSNPAWHEHIQKLFSKPLMIRLSKSALETLAIVGYKQPITLPEISEIRSCNAAGAIKTLLECNFIKVLGRKRVVGRPFLYGTTREFLLHFGLKDLSDMPQLSEFEELIGEKVSPEIFESTHPEMDAEEPEQQESEPVETTDQEVEIFEPPFKE
jgi:segregation and condensation protein B